MWEPEEWVADNYRRLATGLGVQIHELAGRVESDPLLAGWLRRQAPAPVPPVARRTKKQADG